MIGISTATNRHQNGMVIPALLVLVVVVAEPHWGSSCPPSTTAPKVRALTGLNDSIGSCPGADPGANEGPGHRGSAPSIREDVTLSGQTTRDIMHANPPAVTPATGRSTAVDLMPLHRPDGLPVVVQDREVLGFVSELDGLPPLLAASYHCEGDPTVAEVMYEGALTVPPGEGLVDLAQRMKTAKPKVYPVVEHGRLVGLVSRTDLLRALAMNWAACSTPSR